MPSGIPVSEAFHAFQHKLELFFHAFRLRRLQPKAWWIRFLYFFHSLSPSSQALLLGRKALEMDHQSTELLSYGWKSRPIHLSQQGSSTVLLGLRYRPYRHHDWHERLERWKHSASYWMDEVAAVWQTPIIRACFFSYCCIRFSLFLVQTSRHIRTYVPSRAVSEREVAGETRYIDRPSKVAAGTAIRVR